MRMSRCVLGLAIALPGMAVAATPPPTFKDLGPIGNGRRLFVEFNCSQCHNNNAAGGTGTGTDIQNRESLAAVTDAVMHGAPAGYMPAYGRYMNSQDIYDLWVYLNNFGSGNQPTFVEWWVDDPKY